MSLRHLLGREGRLALHAVLQRQPLLAFDFDGTLAPIVSRPDDARVSVAVSRRLAQLARLLPVAIVTGRSIDDVGPRLGFVPQYIVGSHGAEDPLRPPRAVDDRVLWELRRKVAAQAQALAAAGVTVEDKDYSLAFHYRLAKDRAQAAAAIERLLGALEPTLRSFAGKCAVNVVAADAPDKGEAVAALVQRCGAGAAVFVGDDVNDEAVFVRAPPEWLTVKIGRDDPQSHARFLLEHHGEMATVLQEMLTIMQQAAR